MIGIEIDGQLKGGEILEMNNNGHYILLRKNFNTELVFKICLILLIS